MPNTTSANLKLTVQATGENSGTWGQITNTNLVILEQAISGYDTVALNATTGATLTFTNGAVSNGKNQILKLTGTITGNVDVIIPDSIEKTYIIENGTSGAHTVTVKTTSGSGVTWSATDKGKKLIYSDGTDVLEGISSTGALEVSGNLNVDGGTIKLDGNYPVGTDNVALGNGALDDGSLTGGNNTAIGDDALTANTSGGDNTAAGKSALAANTTGGSNTAFGFNSLAANTTGVSNTAVGKDAMDSNTTGGYNVAVGLDALQASTSATNNTAVGQAALNLYTGTGGENTAVGAGAGASITTGSKNTIIGNNNGNEGNLSITTADNNVVLSDGDANVRIHHDGTNLFFDTGQYSYLGTSNVSTPAFGYAMSTGALQSGGTAIDVLNIQLGYTVITGQNDSTYRTVIDFDNSDRSVFAWGRIGGSDQPVTSFVFIAGRRYGFTLIQGSASYIQYTSNELQFKSPYGLSYGRVFEIHTWRFA